MASKLKTAKVVTGIHQNPWKVIVADRDPELHDMVSLAFKEFEFKQRGLELFSAVSGEDLRSLLQAHPDTAVILLEDELARDGSGYGLIENIRHKLQNYRIRLVFCTNQTDLTSVKSLILDYEINDLKLKNELTPNVLFATIVAALRSYHDLILAETGPGESQPAPVQGQLDSAGYLFDQSEISVANDLWSEEMKKSAEQNALVLPVSERGTAVAPLAIYDQVIGVLGVQDDPRNPLSMDEVALVEEVSEQMAQAIAGARLFQQTQAILAQTEALYTGSERVVRAQTIGDVLQALIDSTALNELDGAALLFFDRPLFAEEQPEDMLVAAAWQSGDSPRDFSIGRRYELNQIPAPELLLQRDGVVIVENVATDPRFAATDNDSDSEGQTPFTIWPETQMVISLPLVVGEQWIGIVIAQSKVSLRFEEAEIRQVASLTDQAATVIQTQRLFAQAQARADQERQIRTITDKIRRGSNREAILRIARDEIGQMLGASKTVAQLGTGTQLLADYKDGQENGSS